MKYLLMIFCNEATDAQKSPADQEKEMAAYFAFTDEVGKAGVMRAGEALHPSSTATTVRVRNGKITTTDGPFAETKEQFGGYYVVECNNLDEAIQWAAKIPHAAQDAIEIRPIVDFSQAATGG
jgi:hypothetical protein